MVKVISLSNEAYGRLKARKRNGMSFSDVVIELVERGKNKKDIMKFAGAFARDDDWKKTMDTILENRRKIKMREVKL